MQPSVKTRCFFHDSPSAKAILVKILSQRMQIEINNKQCDMKTIKMLRFDDDEVRQHRDSFAQAEITGINTFMTKTPIVKIAK